MKQSNNFKKTGSVTQSLNAANTTVESLKSLSTSLKTISEAAARLERIAQENLANNNQKRISFTK